MKTMISLTKWFNLVYLPLIAIFIVGSACSSSRKATTSATKSERELLDSLLHARAVEALKEGRFMVHFSLIKNLDGTIDRVPPDRNYFVVYDGKWNANTSDYFSESAMGPDYGFSIKQDRFEINKSGSCFWSGVTQPPSPMYITIELMAEDNKVILKEMHQHGTSPFEMEGVLNPFDPTKATILLDM